MRGTEMLEAVGYVEPTLIENGEKKNLMAMFANLKKA